MDETEQVAPDYAPEAPSGDLIRVEADMSPGEYAEFLVATAKHAPAIKQATETILVTQTYPDDWKRFGNKMALGSAGAERVAHLFPINLSEFKCLGKFEFEDKYGKGYRYVYECRGELHHRQLYSTGTYSTRDKFLGFANDEYRDMADINENDIRMAAYRRCQGNAIKALLGIRNIPVADWERIMKTTAQDGSQAAADAVPFASGTKGGTSKDDKSKQVELSSIVYEIVDAGNVCHYDGGNIEIATNETPPDDPANRNLAAKACLIALTQFEGKDGAVKGVTSYKMLRGKRLNVTLSRTKDVWSKFKDENRD